MSITAVSGSDLLQRGVASTADLSKVVPGFDFTTAAYQQPVYVLRGVGLYDAGLGSSPAVTVYLDQIPLPYPIMTEVSPLDLQRVEVLKGPQGTLFGQNSTGGAINYIAAKPTAEFEAGADVSYGRFDALDATGFVSGPLSDTLQGRFAFRTTQGGAWQESASRPGDRLGNSDNNEGRLMLDWRPDAKLTFELSVNGFHDGSDTQAQQLVAITPSNPAKASAAFLASPLAAANDRSADWPEGEPLHADDTFYQVGLRSDYRLNDAVTLTSLTSYAHMSVNKTADFTGVATPTEQNLGNVLGHIRYLSQELRAQIIQGPAVWTLGANYDYSGISDQERATVTNTTDQPIPSIPAFHYPDGEALQTVNDYAVFGNLDYRFASRFVLHGGLRATESARRGDSCTLDWNPAGDSNALGQVSQVLQELFAAEHLKTTPVTAVAPGGCTALTSGPEYLPTAVHDGLNEKNLSWRVGLDYTFDQGTLLYASDSVGYKAGLISPVIATSTTEFTPTKQERLHAYEVGFKSPLLDRKLQVNGALFYYGYTDKQLRTRLLDPPFGLLNQVINIPQSQIWGLDGSLQAHPIAGLNLSLAATYIESDVTKSFSAYNDEGVYGNFKGSALPFTPKVQVVADGQYQHALLSGVDGMLGASLTIHSTSSTTFNTASAPAPDFKLPAYSLLDLRAGLLSQDGRWRLSLFAHNVTNKYYWMSVGQVTDLRTRLAGMPLTYGINLGWRWR